VIFGQDRMQECKKKGPTPLGLQTPLGLHNPDANDMIVPIAIFAADADGNFTIDRTKHYLMDEFDRLSHGRSQEQSAWQRWVALLDLLSKKVEEAFAGKTNLHEYDSQIDTLSTAYDQLRAEVESPKAAPVNGNLDGNRVKICWSDDRRLSIAR